MKELTAVILAGGVGKRFWPMTTDKTTFPYLDKPFFVHAVGLPLPREVTRVVVIANAENAAVYKNFSFGVPSITVVQKRAGGMADALLSAQSELTGRSLLVIGADDLADPRISHEVVALAKKTHAFGVIPGLTVTSYKPFGYLVLDGEKITGIHEKPGAGNEPSAYVNFVCHYIDNSDILFDQIGKTKSDRDDIYEKALSTLMKHSPFVVLRYESDFATLKYPWHVLDSMDLMLSRIGKHKGKNVQIKNNVQIEGNVYIEDNVKIFENTKIVGPCYIGKNTIIGNNNIIRASHIGANVVTGFNTDITRSYVGDDCWFHSNYIGDSVLEGNISMGSGTVLANLRLDDGEIHSRVKGEKLGTNRTKLGSIIGRGTRIGVNASIMPGIKIGANCFVGAGVVLAQDIPEDTFCSMEPKYVLKKNNKQAAASREEFKKKI